MNKPQLAVNNVTGNMLSDEQLLRIPITHPTELELSDYEVKKIRVRIYSLNKNNATWRFRTLREYPMLMIWRFRKR